ncbi:MAG: magnesium/cobalt transporter CorA [Acidobacteriota bacterium]
MASSGNPGRRHRGRRRGRVPAVRPGSPPGIHTGPPGAEPTRVTARGIAPDRVEVIEPPRDAADLARIRERFPLVWIDVCGMADAETISALGRLAGLHPLVIEDVLNGSQRPKVEDYDAFMFVVARRLGSADTPATHQVAFAWTDGLLVSFRERGEPAFGPIVERLERGRPRIRTSGPDYLVYAMLDLVVDEYFPLLTKVDERLDVLESRALAADDASVVGEIHGLRAELAELRRELWPLREALAVLVRHDTQLVSADTRVFLRDCLDHASQALELAVAARDGCQDLMGAYMSAVSNRMNEVMKVLTIIATIFIPLGFVAGLYGMNFDTSSPWNMPELRWRYGYPFALLVMVGVAGAMLAWFRRRGWL